MDEVLHRLEAMAETITLVGSYKRIESFQGFLGGAGFRPTAVIMFGDQPLAKERLTQYVMIHAKISFTRGSCQAPGKSDLLTGSM